MDYIFENNNDNQECSSGCDSGWTLYLQHSSSFSPTDDHYFSARRTNQLGFSEVVKRSKHEEQDLVLSEEEDMSMVSDASSGPKHNNNNSYKFQDEEENDTNNNNNVSFNNFVSADGDSFHSSDNRKKIKEKRRRKSTVVQDHQSSLLDDTASSPCFDFSGESYRVSGKSLEESVLEYSQGYSTTHYKVRPDQHRVHYDFFNSSPSGNQMEHN